MPPRAVYGGSTKKAASDWLHINSSRRTPSPSQNSSCSECVAMSRSLRTNVSGYHREQMPAPFSPLLEREAPGAKTPPRLVRFSTNVRKPWSRTVRGTSRAIRSTAARVGVKARMRSIRSSECSSAERQKEDTSRSSSTITARAVSPSITAVSDTMPPPANGSTSTATGSASHCRIWGTSHVFRQGTGAGCAVARLLRWPPGSWTDGSRGAQQGRHGGMRERGSGHGGGSPG